MIGSSTQSLKSKLFNFKELNLLVLNKTYVYKISVIFNEKNNLNLTEREANIVIFLYTSKKPVKISQLQTEVWGHNSKLETHTVETHIYRLRKKINNIFNDENFIKSSKDGYSIK